MIIDKRVMKEVRKMRLEMLDRFEALLAYKEDLWVDFQVIDYYIKIRPPNTRWCFKR